MTIMTSRAELREQLARRYCPTRIPAEDEARVEEIKRLLEANNAVLVAHYYTDDAIQQLAEETGGCVADSLEMARFGARHEADTLVVAGVRFMGETAKILSPEKRVLMPTLEATCSLDVGCPADEFSAFCDAHPDRTVVVYANTSAAVKARADWVVTSSIAVDVIEHLQARGEKILWLRTSIWRLHPAQDRGRHAALGRCLHRPRRIQGQGCRGPQGVVSRRGGAGASGIAVLGGRTGRRRRFHLPVDQGRQGTAAAGTDRGHRPRHLLQDAAGGTGKDALRSTHGRRWRYLQELRPLPLDGDERLDNLAGALRHGSGEIFVDEALRQRALKPLERMLNFNA